MCTMPSTLYVTVNCITMETTTKRHREGGGGGAERQRVYAQRVERRNDTTHQLSSFDLRALTSIQSHREI